MPMYMAEEPAIVNLLLGVITGYRNGLPLWDSGDLSLIYYDRVTSNRENTTYQ